MWQAGPCVFVLYYTPLGAWEAWPPVVVLQQPCTRSVGCSFWLSVSCCNLLGT